MKRSTTTSSPNVEILRGRDGRDGRDGIPGPREIFGPPGPKGDTGVPGSKGDRASGVVYACWDHNSCPDGGAQLVYMQVELEDQVILIREVMVIHNVYHWTQNSIKQLVEHRIGPLCMEQKMNGQMD